MQEKNNENFKLMADKFLVGRDESSDLVISNLKEIKNFSKEEAVPLLNYFATVERTPKTLYYIVRELGKYRDRSSSRILIEILNEFKDDQYLNIRCTAANALGFLKAEEAIMSLMYIMNDREENYKLRLGAADALGKIGNSQAVMPLIGIVQDDEEKSVYLKESATKALGMIGDERAVEPLINVLELQKDIIDKFTYLREKIVETLGKITPKKDERLDALKRVLNDKSPHVRASAVEAISEIDDDHIVDIIEPMIFDDNESVAKTAIYAIYNTEGEEGLLRLLGREDLTTFCRGEIHRILDEEDEDDDEYNEEEYDEE